MPKHASSSAAAVRAVILDPTPFTGPREVQAPRTRMQRLLGAGMVGWNVFDDLRVLVMPLLQLQGLTQACDRALTGALDNATIGTVAKLERLLWSEALRLHALPEPTRDALRDVAGVLVFHQASLGCDVASARIAAESFALAHDYAEGGLLDRAFLLYRHARLRASDAQASTRDIPYVPSPDHPRLETLDVQEKVWLQAFTAFGAARRMIEDEDDILRGGAGQQAEPAPQDGDFDFGLPVPEPEAAPARSVEAILSDAKASRAALSMVVIGDLSHVKKGDRHNDPAKEAEAIVDVPLPLVAPPADLVAARAELLADAPHGERIIDRLLRPQASRAFVGNPPVIIWGPPGAGKTRLARRYGEVMGLQPGILSMAGLTDAVPITGTPRGWSSAGFSVVVRDLLRTRIANPLIVVDEGDKIGTSRQNGNACDALMNLLSVETAARYRDVYLQADVDASRVQWIITANGLDTIPRPLVDRCLVLRLDEPGPEHLRPLALSILAEVRRDRGLDERWVPSFDATEWAALERFWGRRGGSLRALRRLVETALDAREAGPRH